MKDRLIRLCSLALALSLTAGWLLLGSRGGIGYPDSYANPHPGAGESPAAVSAGETGEAALSYHFDPASSPALPPIPTVCSSCHGDYAHTKAVFSRPFLNAHAARLDCMVCHLDAGTKRSSRLGWFEISPDGSTPSAGTNMNAFLARYTKKKDEAGDMKVWDSSQKNSPANKIVDEKHRATFDNPPCSDCHSAQGLAAIKKQGYDGQHLERLGKMENIMAFSQGKVFYYPRF